MQEIKMLFSGAN